jgi:hypothetical protein
MSALEIASSAANVVVCVRNEGYELDLKPWQIYEVVPDESLEPDDVRVIDETGEDYIYPANYFVFPSSGAPVLGLIVWKEAHIGGHFRALDKELAIRVLRRNYPKGRGYVPTENNEED